MKRERDVAFWGEEAAETYNNERERETDAKRRGTDGGDTNGRNHDNGESSVTSEARQMVQERTAEVERLEAQLLDAKVKLAKAERILQRLDPSSCSTKPSTNEKLPLVLPNGLSPVPRARPVGGGVGSMASGSGSTGGPSNKRMTVESERNFGGREGGGLKGLPQEAKAPAKVLSKNVFLPPPPRSKPLPASTDVIPLIRSKWEPETPRLSQPIYLTSQHKRKLRTLVLNPENPSHCITSALDGYVHFWTLQQRGRDLELRFSTDCMTKNRRWPESVAWHSSGEQLAVSFAADQGDSQVALLQNKSKPPLFLTERPHEKGVINCVAYMPWDEPVQFVTAGSDHLVALWTHKEDGTMDVKKLHKTVHTAAASSAAGLFHRKAVVSCGMDRRVALWDMRSERLASAHMLDNKASEVLPNPADHNLLGVQTTTPGQQLRLFDFRAPKIQMHSFGWEQKSSDSQSALITSSWSPDGLFLTAGSADPIINLFDIRYNSKVPASTVPAHTKRVFKAVWHSSYPLVVSISSDLNIGLHRID